MVNSGQLDLRAIVITSLLVNDARSNNISDMYRSKNM